MARRKRKRPALKAAALIGAAGAAATLLRRKLAGGGGQEQTFSEAARPSGQEQRPETTTPPPVRPATATGEGTGSATTEGSEELETAQHDTLTPIEGTDEVVVPPDSKGDPLVEEETAKAAAEAGSVGGNVQELAESEPGFPSDPEMRPVIEGSGDDPEAAEQADAELGGNRQRRP
jgi:hypothetical protein